MSRRREDHIDRPQRSTTRGALLLLLLAGPGFGPAANAAHSLCAAAEPLSPDAAVQRMAGASGEDLYEVVVEEPGVLALDVAAPLAAGSGPRLTLLASDCLSPTDGAEWARVHETPRGLVLRIREPTTFHLRVSPEDPDVPLTDYTLRSIFSAEPEASGEVVQRASGLMKEVDPWEDDEWSGLVAQPGVIVVEAVGPGFDAAVHRDLSVRFFELCDTDTDHDRPLCGAPLAAGGVVSGTIDDAADDDYSTFTLESQTTVVVELSGGEGVRGVLYDHGGQRLAMWTGGLVRTLGPGRFYVQVGSINGWVGHYAVGLELLP